jgi:ABC-type Mn2+/Zn2+ transport system permease subunit
MTDYLQLDFLRNALVASLLIGLMLSVMGILVVLRRIVFVGAALSQASAAGIALAMLVAGIAGSHGSPGLAWLVETHPETIAIASTLVAAALLSLRPRFVNLPSEGAIGLGYALASTLAILLIAKAPGAEGDTLLLFYGNILAVKPKEVVELAVLCPALLTVHALFQKEFFMTSFNPETARAAGVRVGLWSFLLYLTLGCGIATGIRVAGSLLTFSYLVVPALAGIMIGRKSWHVMATAVAVALSATFLGIEASVRWDLPSGPTIVAALLAEAGAVWLVARFRQ